MKKALVITTLILIAFSSVLAQSELEKNFKELSDQILGNLQSFYPVEATARGIHDYDFELTDYSSGSVSSEIKKLKKFEVRMHKYSKSRLLPESRINLKLLKSNVDIALHNLTRLKTHKTNPYSYVDEVINGIYYILISEHAPMEIRIHAVIARMKLVPDLLNQAKKNLKEPPPSFVRLTREFISTGIDFYRSVQTEMSSQFPELATDINRAAADAIAALNNFDQFLSEITPGPVGSFAIGKQNYDYKLQYQYFLDIDSDSLLKAGENLLAKYQKEYDEYLESLDKSSEGADSVFVLDCLTREDILRYYQWETEQTKLFISEHDLITIPDDIGECIVVETPDFLTNVIPSIAYQPPGTFNSVQTGYFYVRPIPDSMDQEYLESRYKYIQRRGFKGSVVHEAYPGHHLQFQMAARVANPVRKWQRNACYYEGWALYSEEMMYDQGFYGDDKRVYLKILRGIIFRAARIVIDVRIQTGTWSRDEAVNWMADLFETDTTWVSREVNWYSLQPTVPMSYLVGKIELLNLLEAYRKSKGDQFDLKEFHDKFLAESAVPPKVIWDIWGLTKN